MKLCVECKKFDLYFNEQQKDPNPPKEPDVCVTFLANPDNCPHIKEFIEMKYQTSAIWALF